MSWPGTPRYRMTVSLLFAAFTALYTAGFFVEEVFRDEPAWKLWGVATGSLLIWLLLAAVFFGCWVERVLLTDEGVERRSWRGVQRIRWQEVASLKVPEGEEALDLSRKDAAGTLRISPLLDGLWALEPYLALRFGPDVAGMLAPLLPARTGSGSFA